MGASFTKLFAGLTESTVWVEPYPTRVLWVSMLSWADQWGRVHGSVPGIARRAGINLDECEAALASFMAPDRFSRTPDHDGRRIEKIDGGWRLLNYEKYRAIRHEEDRREQNREAQRRHREKLAKEAQKSAEDVSIPPDSKQNQPPSAQAEAEAEEESKSTTLSGKPDGAPLEGKEKTPREEAKAILAFLNEKAGRAYQPTEVNLEFIMARLKEGYTPTQCRQVIAKKCREWLGRDEMAPYLRPATLFNCTKFNNYAGELVNG